NRANSDKIVTGNGQLQVHDGRPLGAAGWPNFTSNRNHGWCLGGDCIPGLVFMRCCHMVSLRCFCSAIRAKSVISKTSPRALGSTLAAVRICSASAGEPAQLPKAARRVLRRCANATSITSNTCCRDVVVGGGWCAGRQTSPDRIRGAGQNIVVPTVPASVACPYQAILTAGTP